jgi:hypothetical protein
MKSDYDISNDIINIKHKRFSKKYIKALSSCETLSERVKHSQLLLNYLCDIFNIIDIKVVVSNSPQPKKGKGTLCGYYDGSKIKIYNLTPKKHNVVSVNSYIDTLLHEFMHHYDKHKIHLVNSYHTLGFYKRIDDLKKKLS